MYTEFNGNSDPDTSPSPSMIIFVEFSRLSVKKWNPLIPLSIIILMCSIASLIPYSLTEASSFLMGSRSSQIFWGMSLFSRDIARLSPL